MDPPTAVTGRFTPSDEERETLNKQLLAATKSSYETDALMSQYLSLHFGPLEIAFADFLAEIGILAEGLDFPKKCGELVLRWAAEQGTSCTKALDLGCAVGRSSFEMARTFQQVIGIDLSQTFIDMANKMKQEGRVEYRLKVEGDITQEAVAAIDSAIDASRCTFLQVRYDNHHSRTAFAAAVRFEAWQPLASGASKVCCLILCHPHTPLQRCLPDTRALHLVT